MTGYARMAGVAAGVAVVVAVTAWGFTNLSRGSVMSGVVTRAGAASVTARDQLGVSDHIVVDSVTAPERSWLVAYRVGMDGMPGALLGYVAIPAGVSHDVRVPIDPGIRLTEFAIISVNADRGVRGRFEFAMDRFEASPDKPYYAAGRAIQAREHDRHGKSEPSSQGCAPADCFGDYRGYSRSEIN